MHNDEGLNSKTFSTFSSASYSSLILSSSSCNNLICSSCSAARLYNTSHLSLMFSLKISYRSLLLLFYSPSFESFLVITIFILIFFRLLSIISSVRKVIIAQYSPTGSIIKVFEIVELDNDVILKYFIHSVNLYSHLHVRHNAAVQDGHVRNLRHFLLQQL